MANQSDEVREPAVAYERRVDPLTDRVEHLVSSGRLRRAKLDLLLLGSPPTAPHKMSLSDALAEQRSES